MILVSRMKTQIQEALVALLAAPAPGEALTKFFKDLKDNPVKSELILDARTPLLTTPFPSTNFSWFEIFYSLCEQKTLNFLKIF